LVLALRGRSADAALVVGAVVGNSIVTRAAKELYLAPRPPTMDIGNGIGVELPGELLIVLAAIGAVVGVIRGRGLRAIVGASIVIGVLGIEWIVNRLVPVTPGFDSYPSGHASSAAALATAVVLAGWNDPHWRWPAVAVAIAYAAIVGVSRLYLGVHYPADVVAGWSLGLAWGLAWWIAIRVVEARLAPVTGDLETSRS
jgi:membrane-associated phospholipid phosphatase